MNMSDAQRIVYKGPVILVGGGDVDEDRLRQVLGLAAPVVAVDSGANELRQMDITPDVIIGDMDSVSALRGWPADTRIVEIAEQDSTDFEKALYTIAAPFYLAFGVLGRRLDHSLAAFHCLAKYRTRKSIVLVDTVDVAFVPTVPLSIDLPPGSRISIYPIVPVTFVRSRGLRYPLDGLTLATGVAVGTSNIVTETEVSVVPAEPGAGDYMVIVSNTHLRRVIEWYYTELRLLK